MEPHPYRDQAAELAAAQAERNVVRTQLLARDAKIASLEDQLGEHAKSARLTMDWVTAGFGALLLFACIVVALIALSHNKFRVAGMWTLGAAGVILVYRRILGRRWWW